MARRFAQAAALLAGGASAASTLLSGGTVVAFDSASNSLRVHRGGSVLIVDDRITGVFDSASPPEASASGANVTVVDVTGKIVTPGFVDTHRHGWQTAFKTLASNTSLIEYFGRYGEFVAGAAYTPDDVYIGQLAGLYEALAAGVTTTLDHAHHTWSDETAEAGLRASIDSGARVFWGYAFHNVTNYTIPEQLVHFRKVAEAESWKGSPTELAIAYDNWGPNPVLSEVNAVIGLAKEFNVSAVTTHSLQGPWGYSNSPEDIQALGFLNTSIPIVFSHGSFLTALGATLLRSTNQFVSITPESEMHYGHTHPHSHLFQDQSALGVDTHFTFSTDILTQARLWLQKTRYHLYDQVLQNWRLARNNPMSAYQAFMLATRQGGLALRRPDIGVIAPGAKADLVLWDGDSPALLGWRDPVAAVILHASVGDVDSVMVNGKWVKRDGKIVANGYPDVRKRFLASAKKIQEYYANFPYPAPEPVFASGFEITDAYVPDSQRGSGNGYGQTFL